MSNMQAWGFVWLAFVWNFNFGPQAGYDIGNDNVPYSLIGPGFHVSPRLRFHKGLAAGLSGSHGFVRCGASTQPHKLAQLCALVYLLGYGIWPSLGWRVMQPHWDPFKASAIADAPFPSLTYGVHTFLWWDGGKRGPCTWTWSG